MGRHAKYTDEMITEMIRLRHAGLTAAEVGEKYGVSGSTIAGILRYHRPGAAKDIWTSRLDRMAQRWKDGYSAGKSPKSFGCNRTRFTASRLGTATGLRGDIKNDRNGYENRLECAAPHRAGKKQRAEA